MPVPDTQQTVLLWVRVKLATQVKHQPRKQIIIHEMATYDSVQRFVDVITVGMPAGSVSPPLRWIDGIVMTFTALPTNTEFIAKERTKGVLYWDHLAFAPMPKFTSHVTAKNNAVVNVTDVSENETFQSISAFLKKKLKSRQKQARML